MKYIADILYIEKFRRINNQSIKLASRINVFSGQNGVGKSNLLSLIATIFGTKAKRATGGNFFPEFNDYFVINEEESFKEYKSYLKVRLSEDQNKIIQKRHGYKDSRNENRGIRVLPRSTNYFIQNDDQGVLEQINQISGDSKIPVPTIFLSLSRLFPVGETSVHTRNIRSDNKVLNQDIFTQYAEWYNQVLPNSITKSVDSGKLVKKDVVKNTNLHIELNYASLETQSVGQDNLGCIISALVDFYALKNSLGQDYIGGILCIDEIDASLHPSAQIKLFELLNNVSESLSLQIFLSTHSLTILKEILNRQKENCQEYKLIYIVDPFEPRVSSNISTYEELKADLFDNVNYFRPRVKVYCEDDMTKFILEKILSSNTLELIDRKFEFPAFDILPVHLGCNNLKALPNYDSHFKNVVIVLDGDAKTDKTHLLKKYLDGEELSGYNSKKLPVNCISLPTYLPPESYLYYILYKLIYEDKYNSFWLQLDKIPNARLYTKNKLIDKVISKFNIDENFSNDLFKKSIDTLVLIRDFFDASNVLSYFYTHDYNKDELKQFLEQCQKTFSIVNSKMKANL